MASSNDERRMIVFGNNGSPYSCKIRSYLRYKQIPFEWKPHLSMKWPLKYEHIRPKTIPVVEFKNGFSMNESTKIIQKIEEKYVKRSVIPSNGCYAFLSDLLEDFADEWFTKIMFAMRWNRKIDQKFGSLYITDSVPAKIRKVAAEQMTKRQVSRRKIVGCSDDNEMHASMHEICALFEAYLKEQNNAFLFCDKPTNADFALFGQMSQWKVDMTPNKILRDCYPLTLCWIDSMNDLSGFEVTDCAQFKMTKIGMSMLRICGNVYLPFLKANDEALKAGKDGFEIDLAINGKIFRHKQGTFRWQQKCLNELRKKLEKMKGDKYFDELQRILKETGCWDVLSQKINMSKL